jgi:hypothetical protein
MPGCRRAFVLAVVVMLSFCLLGVLRPNYASCQQSDRESDQAAAERVLGAQWKQVSRRAGMIFAGTVLSEASQSASLSTAVGDRSIGRFPTTVQLSFRVDHAIAGVETGQTLTIHEWTGAQLRFRPMRRGQHILIFLYPMSRLGLTSPVGGASGQFELDRRGQNIRAIEHGPAAAIDTGSTVFSRSRALASKDIGIEAGVSVNQLERAIGRAREE